MMPAMGEGHLINRIRNGDREAAVVVE